MSTPPPNTDGDNALVRLLLDLGQKVAYCYFLVLWKLALIYQGEDGPAARTNRWYKRRTGR